MVAKKNIIYFCFNWLLLTFFQCGVNDDVNLNEGLLVLDVPAFERTIGERKLSFKKIIPLCTNEENQSFLRKVSKLRITEGEMFILDGAEVGRKLFKFDHSGNLQVFRPSSVDGKKTLYAINDIFTDSNYIYLIDSHMRLIYKCNSKLDIVQEILGSDEVMLNGYVLSFEDLNYFLIRPELQPVPESSILVGSVEGEDEENYIFNALDRFEGVAGQKPTYFPIVQHENFASSIIDHSALYFDVFNSSIWAVNNEKAIKKYEINMPGSVWFQKDDRMFMAKHSLPEAIDYLKKSGKGYIYDYVREERESITISFRQGQYRNWILANLASQEIKAFQIKVESEDENLIAQDYLFANLVGSDDSGAMIFDISIEYLSSLLDDSADGGVFGDLDVSKFRMEPYCNRALLFMDFQVNKTDH